MSSEQYKILSTYSPEEWIPNCPANIQKWQLLKDTVNNCILLQIKHFNSTEKVIKSVYVTIKCFDDTKDLLAEYNGVASVQGTYASPGSEFYDTKNPVVIDNSKTTNVLISVDKVLFDDGEIWRNENKEALIDTSTRKPLNLAPLYIEQLDIEYNKKYNNNTQLCYKYENYDSYWICGCGQFNESHKDKCSRCRTHKTWLEEHLNLEYLKSAMDERLCNINEEKYQKAATLLFEADNILETKKSNIINLISANSKANQALEILRSISDYKDSATLIIEYKEKSELTPTKIFNALKDRNTIIIIVAIIISLSIILTLALKCDHENKVSATCTSPKTCSDCGKTFGEPNPHTYNVEPTCTTLAHCIDCNNPKSLIGEGDSTTYEHDTDKEPTCTESAKCKRCGTTLPSLSHDWSIATCTEPAVCKRCNISDNKPLGHKMDMEKCAVCGETVGKKIFEDDKTVVYHVDTEWFGGSEVVKEKTFTLWLVIENKSDALVRFQTRDEKINGKSASELYYCSEDIERNSKIKTSITISDFGYSAPFSSFGVNTLEDVKNLSFKVYLDGYYYNHFQSSAVTVTP